MFFDKQLIEQFKQWMKGFGLAAAIGKLFTALGVKDIKVIGRLPKIGPVLVISNHTGVFDSLLLLNKINRQDFYLIALATYHAFGGILARRAIPIYRRRRLNHKIYEYPLCLQINGKLPKDYSGEEIRARNRQSIKRAAELINQGKTVSIFPTGNAGKKLTGSSWKPGAGFLVKQITNSKTKLVLAKISGTRMSDLIAYVPLLRRLFFRPRPIRITFSRAILLNRSLDLSQDAKAITRQLEKLYNQTYL
ncbi:hypothetical protein COW80_03825 [Candidatus Beckwithbacteria bacterium CG22_combo_CG10-13_8_21_14_all_01_47_9]|uniref:Phospholipid/glycerol acyltransferase domain-containing protein n=1 Tax=Candidatus Beckwithbacteria bacterium CG22_combo_CG10-13_8_21_14_all_01_47_9 TaxID=1974496 RepID=A0A2H0E1K7_9BACT|nr:MAG: hypothetical protein COW80_03825 [Candidatus Beckwithbacteria bacterium CG22_combo_CG10-13_8_21_14_all_01_47_9]PIR57512.1 MAG: hypothetical protein COU72_00525 [Parcubacteria group bacterium CG10_big_fil_rev_8_21_14_0_10_41_35]